MSELKTGLEETIKYYQHMCKLRGYTFNRINNLILLEKELVNAEYLTILNESNPYFKEFHKKMSKQGYEITSEEQSVMVYTNEQLGPGLMIAINESGIIIYLDTQEEINKELIDILDELPKLTKKFF